MAILGLFLRTPTLLGSILGFGDHIQWCLGIPPGSNALRN